MLPEIKLFFFIFVFNLTFLAGNRDVEEVEINQQTDEEPHLKSASVAPGSSKAITPDPGEDSEHLSIDGDGSVRSVSSLGWAAAQPPASREGLASSHGRRSSCSTVRITEEQLVLNPVRPEVGGKNTQNKQHFFLCLSSLFISRYSLTGTVSLWMCDEDVPVF